MRSLLTAMVLTALGAAVLVPARGGAQTFKGSATSKDGTVVVSYDVKDGYKITISIDTRRKKGAYRHYGEGDVSNLHVELLDLNGDSRPDVIVKLADESGYSPTVLINQDDLSFVDALERKELFFVETEPAIVAPGKAVPRGAYRLKPTAAGRPPDLVFDDVVIGRNRYRDATFRLDPRSSKYALVAKGKSLGVVGDVDEP